MKEVVIVSGCRTALGSYNGSLAAIGGTRLGAIVMDEAVRRAGIDKEKVDEVIMGMVLPCGYGQNPAKQAAVMAGMPWHVGGLTVNKVCGSGLKAVMLAAQAIQVRRRRRGHRGRHGEHEHGALLSRKGPLRLPDGARQDRRPHGP